MIDLQAIGNRIADTHNMLNDLEIRGGKNFKIVVYAQENCKSILNEISKELEEQKKQSVVVPLINESSKVASNDNPTSTE